MRSREDGAPKDNAKRLATPQSLNGAVKAICDVMRRSNCAGAPPRHAGPLAKSLANPG